MCLHQAFKCCSGWVDSRASVWSKWPIRVFGLIYVIFLSTIKFVLQLGFTPVKGFLVQRNKIPRLFLQKQHPTRAYSTLRGHWQWAPRHTVTPRRRRMRIQTSFAPYLHFSSQVVTLVQYMPQVMAWKWLFLPSLSTDGVVNSSVISVRAGVEWCAPHILGGGRRENKI